MSCLLSGMPSSIMSESMCSVWFDVVATWMSSQLTGVEEMAAHRASGRPASSSSGVLTIEIPASRLDGIFGLLGVQSVLVNWLSSRRGILVGLVEPVGWRERASLVLLRTPGMWIKVKRYLRVLSSTVYLGCPPGICCQIFYRGACGPLRSRGGCIPGRSGVLCLRHLRRQGPRLRLVHSGILQRG